MGEPQNIKLEACIKTLLHLSPILGYIVQELDRVPTDKIETMGVGFIDNTARLALYYNKKFVSAISEEVLIKIILPHEIGHIINGHINRYDGTCISKLRKHIINIGCDLAVNNESFIDFKLINKCENEVKEYIASNYPLRDNSTNMGILLASKFGFPPGKTSDYYIAQMIKSNNDKLQNADLKNKNMDSSPAIDSESTTGNGMDAQPQKNETAGAENQPSGSQKLSSENIQGCNPIDSHIFLESDLSELSKNSIRRSVLENAYKEWKNGGKRMGNVSKDLIEIVEDILFPKQPVTRAFNNIIGSLIGSDFELSSSKMNKRIGSYMQMGKRIKNTLKLAVIVDTSLSMNQSELAVFRGMLKRVIQTLKPKVWILHSDVKVNKIEEIRGETIPVKFHGRGGTSFTEAFKKITELKLRPDGVIFFTDGRGTLAPEVSEPYRVLWVITENGERQRFMNNKKHRVIELSKYELNANEVKYEC